MISIIIPCYNVAECVSATLNSIINQTDKDYEIIAVNDGSTDNTLAILTQYQQITPRMVVIDKKNGGVSSARNVGMQSAKGDFLLFIDGDDLIEPTLIEELNAHCNDGTDYILYGWEYMGWPDKTKPCIPTVCNDYVDSYLTGHVLPNVSTSVIKRTLTIENDIKWDENTYFSEDREFIVRCMLVAKNVCVIPKVLFKYVHRGNSAMHVPEFTSKRLSEIYAVERTYNRLKKTSRADISTAFIKCTIVLLMRFYNKSNCTDTSIKNELSRYGEAYLKKSNRFRFNKYSIYAFVMGLLYRIKPVFRIAISI